MAKGDLYSRALQVLAERAREGLVVQGRDRQILFANDIALGMLGASSIQELRTTPVKDTTAQYEIFDEEGHSIRFEQLPIAKVLAGASHAQATLRFRRPGEADRWSRVECLPLLGANNQIEAAVSILTDITHEKTEEVSEFLANASTLLASSLNYEETLSRLAHLAVPAIADWCAVDIIEDGELRRVAVVHNDPAKVALAKALQENMPAALLEQQARRLSTGESQLLEDVSAELIDELVEDGAIAELLKGLGLKSVATVPLKARAGALGELSVIYAESNRRYGPRDLRLLQDLGERAGIAIENARLYRDVQLAKAQLEKSNQAKDEFLGIVSHELRSPLTTILGSARGCCNANLITS